MTYKTPVRPAGHSGKDLRTLLENRPVTILGAPFPLAAKEIERQGFPAVYLSGAALSAGLLGIPDIGHIPFETLEHQTSQLTKNVTIPVIVDAGIGCASDAAYAMELGAEGVLTNTAIAQAQNPMIMAEAMKHAIQAGRMSYLAGRIPKRPYATASSPVDGMIQF